MNPITSEHLVIEPMSGQFPDDLCLIVGAGHFGKRAARILKETSDSPILIIDKDKDRIESIEPLHTEKIVSDGVNFLVKNIQSLNPSSVIVPAIPVHLASEWLKIFLEEHGWEIQPIRVPEEIIQLLPHTWQGTGGTLLISYTDFLCPDDCPEPSDHCHMTGETRSEPLHELLNRLSVPLHQIHVIRSRQLAPGLGGYKAEDLTNLYSKVSQGEGKWLVGTACKCHGALTGVEVIRKAHGAERFAVGG